jgi:phosphopantothenoylcysteine decarboxylase/phosphopantothenate--cysteine ligase
MHTEMWENPATQANIAALRERGVVIVGPEPGQLTGTDVGPGRMSEPDVIVAAALRAVAERSDLVGKRILVTAGGTREPIDPVRFIGNRSSGKQGLAIAKAAAARGAEVTLIAANLEVSVPASLTIVRVSTTEELADATAAAAAYADAIIMAAAVADYRPEHVSSSKLKKDDADSLTLQLVRNPDILASLSEHRTPGQLIIGFAAETEPDDAKRLELGRTKIARKGCDYLVLNRVGATEGFATDRNTVVVINAAGDIVSEASGTKQSVADRILDLLSTPSA